MKKFLVVVGLIVLVVGSVAGYYGTRKADSPAITTAEVSRGEIVSTVAATGTVQPVKTVQVGSQVSGTIASLNADFNSIVRKGQILAKVDPSLFQTQVEQQRANVGKAQADVDRLRVALEDAKVKLARSERLWNGKLIPETDLETAQVNVRSAQAQLQSAQAQVVQAEAVLHQAEVNLSQTVITSPIDGIVVSRDVDVGQTVAASMQAPTLFVLANDLTRMQVNASVDEADVGQIQPGQVVRFRVDAFPSDEFRGTVSQVRLQPVVVQNVTTYTAIVDVVNDELKLKPGMTATLTIEVARRNDVLRVPAAALRFRASAEVFAALGQPVPKSLESASRARTWPAGTGSGPAARPARGVNGAGTGANGAGAAVNVTGAAAKGTGGQLGSSPARAWVMANGLLEPVPLRVGITDGAYTEVVEGDLAVGATVVTSVATSTARQATQSGAGGASPVSPFNPPRGLAGGRAATR